MIAVIAVIAVVMVAIWVMWDHCSNHMPIVVEFNLLVLMV